MTEKRKPTHDLERFKAALTTVERLEITTAALKTAAALGFARTDIIEIVTTMKRSHFQKSMTAYADHRTWQDVYHVPSAAGTLYVKFTTGTAAPFVILSFKAKDDD